MSDSTQRFTGRVEDYARYRPAYPPELLDLLRRECGLTEDTVVADVGTGSGDCVRRRTCPPTENQDTARCWGNWSTYSATMRTGAYFGSL